MTKRDAPSPDKHKMREALEAQVMEAIDSGPAIEVTPEFWKELKARVHKKLAKDGAVNRD